MSAAALLGDLADALVTGAIRVVDLTQPLKPETPILALPPAFGQSWPFALRRSPATTSAARMVLETT